MISHSTDTPQILSSSFSLVTDMPPAPAATSLSTRANPFSFWWLGLFNNASWVIMVACAKAISEGGTALVFLANTIPAFAIKLSAPYWFDRVSYRKRLMAATCLMAGAFLIVALFISDEGQEEKGEEEEEEEEEEASESTGQLSLWMQLFGVALMSAQCGLGEASLLALAGKCDADRDKNACLTCFSSGTGLAGVFGFFWKFIFNDWLGLSLRLTLCLAQSMAASYGLIYYKSLWDIGVQEYIEIPVQPNDDEEETNKTATSGNTNGNGNGNGTHPNGGYQADALHDVVAATDTQPTAPAAVMKIEDMNTRQRIDLLISLWPYMIPLFLVYVAEYALQAGTWTAIGFPVEDERARNKFYEYSNWMYQIGVFLSRSSGTVFTANMFVLWLMPTLQCLNVVFFWSVAKNEILYNNFLLIPCFYVGLLGGAVYINGYTRICLDLPIEHREFALSSTSVAESVGIVVADISGLFLQACLYGIHNIQGAVVACPVKFD